MKYSKKRDRFEGSNVWFSQTDMTAKSYDWWVFVRSIKGVVYFNDHSYSQSTTKHQMKVSRLLDDLGIEYQTVDFRSSLANLVPADIKRLGKEQIALKAKELEEKRIARNAKAKAKRLESKQANGGAK